MILPGSCKACQAVPPGRFGTGPYSRGGSLTRPEGDGTTDKYPGTVARTIKGQKTDAEASVFLLFWFTPRP